MPKLEQMKVLNVVLEQNVIEEGQPLPDDLKCLDCRFAEHCDDPRQTSRCMRELSDEKRAVRDISRIAIILIVNKRGEAIVTQMILTEPVPNEKLRSLERKCQRICLGKSAGLAAKLIVPQLKKDLSV